MQDPAAAAAAAFQPIKPQFPEQEQLKCPRCDSTNTKFCYYNNYNLSQPRHFCKNCRRYWTKGGALRNIPVGGGTRKNTKRSSTSQKRANPDPGPDPSPDRTSRRVPESASPTSTRTATAAAAAAEKPTLMGGQNSGSGQEPILIYGLEGDQDRKLSFSSLLSSNSQFGSIFGGLNSIGSGFKMVPMGGFVEDLHSVSHSGSGPRLGLDVQGGSENNNNNNKTGGGGGGGSGGDSENYLQGSSEWGNSNGWPDLAIYTPGSSYQPIEGKPKKYFV